MTDTPETSLKIRTETPPPAHQVQEASGVELMNNLIGQCSSLEEIEKAMGLHKEWEERQAKKAYFAAMAAFRADPPDVVKSVTVDYKTSKGRTHYTHADLGEACGIINAALAPHGLSPSWEPEQRSESLVCVTCTITHALGYSQSITLCGPPDSSGGKDPLKSIGSTVSILSRYTLFSILGIAARGQDSEAPTPQGLSPKELSEIMDLVDTRIASKADFLTFLQVPSFEAIPAHRFTEVRQILLDMGPL